LALWQALAMRVVPRRWNNETWVCSLRGHVTPAGSVRELRSIDGELGVDLVDGRRLARCLRCDVWVATPPVADDAPEHLPPHDELPRPRRGKSLEDAILLRLIAFDRAIHSIMFTLLAIGLGLLETNLGQVQRVGANLADKLDIAVSDSGQQASRSFVSRSFHEVLNLHQHELKVLLVTAIAYAVVEGIEAVGLWRERRWAEYLTVVATAGFLPFELVELTKKVTAFRIGALVLNGAVLLWLLWSKRLFGLRGGAAELEAAARRASDEVLRSFEPNPESGPSSPAGPEPNPSGPGAVSDGSMVTN
jgi:uncharacterized membrane protein (DUF2068 family)